MILLQGAYLSQAVVPLFCFLLWFFLSYGPYFLSATECGDALQKRMALLTNRKVTWKCLCCVHIYILNFIECVVHHFFPQKAFNVAPLVDLRYASSMDKQSVGTFFCFFRETFSECRRVEAGACGETWVLL